MLPIGPNCTLNVWIGGSPLTFPRPPDYTGIPARQLRPLVALNNDQRSFTLPGQFLYRYWIEPATIPLHYWYANTPSAMFIEVVGTTSPLRFVQVVTATNIVMAAGVVQYLYCIAGGFAQLP